MDSLAAATKFLMTARDEGTKVLVTEKKKKNIKISHNLVHIMGQLLNTIKVVLLVLWVQDNSF